MDNDKYLEMTGWKLCEDGLWEKWFCKDIFRLSEEKAAAFQHGFDPQLIERQTGFSVQGSVKEQDKGDFMSNQFENAGKTNRYTCTTCTSAIVTIDREEGVTPFCIGCRATEGCKGMMNSAMYGPGFNGVDGEPTYEWRKPTYAEYMLLDHNMRDHVDRGGLVLYSLDPDAVPSVVPDIAQVEKKGLLRIIRIGKEKSPDGIYMTCPDGKVVLEPLFENYVLRNQVEISVDEILSLISGSLTMEQIASLSEI